LKKNKPNNVYKISFGVSGKGTTFESIMRAIKSGEFVMEPILVFADRECRATEVAKKMGLKTWVKKTTESIETFHKKVFKELNNNQTDVVILAGYLRLFPVSNDDPFLVLNSHPAATPQFGGTGFWGIRVHETVLDFAHATKFRHPYTYSSVHIATGEYDQGPVIGLKKMEILKTDTPESLAERLLSIEHKNYTEVLKRFSNNLVEYQNSPRDLIMESEKELLKTIKKNVFKRYNIKKGD